MSIFQRRVRIGNLFFMRHVRQSKKQAELKIIFYIPLYLYFSCFVLKHYFKNLHLCQYFKQKGCKRNKKFFFQKFKVCQYFLREGDNRKNTFFRIVLRKGAILVGVDCGLQGVILWHPLLFLYFPPYSATFCILLDIIFVNRCLSSQNIFERI